MKQYRTVANASRIEIDPNTNDMYLVFKVVDQNFKDRVRNNWNKDIPVQLLGKELVEEFDADV
jgi:hypothetical protein